jgi:hypothetical protein
MRNFRGSTQQWAVLARRGALKRDLTPDAFETHWACRKHGRKQRKGFEISGVPWGMAAISKSNHNLIAKLAKLVRELNPLPQVRDLIEPLRPEPAPPLATTRPSWERFASSFEPPVRDLRPGARPREWANDDDAVALEANGTPSVASSPASGEEPPASEPELLPAAPAELPPITGPQQYQMQFTTSEEHVKLVERAKATGARATRPRAGRGAPRSHEAARGRAREA